MTFEARNGSRRYKAETAAGTSEERWVRREYKIKVSASAGSLFTTFGAMEANRSDSTPSRSLKVARRSSTRPRRASMTLLPSFLSRAKISSIAAVRLNRSRTENLSASLTELSMDRIARPRNSSDEPLSNSLTSLAALAAKRALSTLFRPLRSSRRSFIWLLMTVRFLRISAFNRSVRSDGVS